jgi:hypothetical protein
MLRQMKAKLSSATGSGGKGGKGSPGQGERQPSGLAAPGSKQHPGAPPENRPGGANGPAQPHAGGGGAVPPPAPADQRNLLPPLTPEEMRRQYAGGSGA